MLSLRLSMALRTSRLKTAFTSLLVLGAFAAGLWALMYWRSSHGPLPSKTTWQAGPATLNALDLTWQNYGAEAQAAAQRFDLPADYLLALITLECSGRIPAGARFEPGVYNRLLAVRSGDRRKYEQVKTSHLADASDAAVTNLATSWGPFQLMGYKCIDMEVNISDIRGDSAVWYGARWIAEEYGKHLRKGHFQDAFHIHNTGRKIRLWVGLERMTPLRWRRGWSAWGGFARSLRSSLDFAGVPPGAP